MLQVQSPYTPNKIERAHHTNLLPANPESLFTKAERGDILDRGSAAKEIHSWGEIELESYGDYLDMQSEGFSSEKGIVTDRFIPARKHLRLDPTPFEIE